MKTVKVRGEYGEFKNQIVQDPAVAAQKRIVMAEKLQLQESVKKGLKKQLSLEKEMIMSKIKTTSD